MSQFWNSCILRGFCAWGFFCGPALPGWLISTYHFGQDGLEYDLVTEAWFPSPIPLLKAYVKLVCLCLTCGLVWGVKFECHVCWGWAQGFCLRWSMLSPYRCSACTGIDVFEWCILRQMGGLTWLRGCSNMADLPGDKQMKLIEIT